MKTQTLQTVVQVTRKLFEWKLLTNEEASHKINTYWWILDF
jgi:hypothetical protein